MDHSTDDEISWDEQTQQQFEQLIAKIPVFLRGMAKEKVSKKAQSIVRNDNRTVISEKDMVDAFGRCPPLVQRLLELADIRIRSRDFGIVSIHLEGPDVVFGMENLRAGEPLFAEAPGSVRTPDERTVHLRLPESYLEASTLVAVLRQMFRKACVATEMIP